jgi:hypothetical protein
MIDLFFSPFTDRSEEEANHFLEQQVIIPYMKKLSDNDLLNIYRAIVDQKIDNDISIKLDMDVDSIVKKNKLPYTKKILNKLTVKDLRELKYEVTKFFKSN